MTSFRDLHQGPGAFVIPNPWDPGSAVMLHRMGFKALATTSAGMAFAMGRAEGSVPFDAMLDHCRAIVAATPLPVSADLEYGLGHSPEDAARTIYAVAETGVAGCSLEDHTGDPDHPIYDFDQAVARIAAAAKAVADLSQDIVFTARCENFLWDRPDIDDTIKRLQAYEAAGADVLYAPGLRDIETIRTVCGALSKPVNVIMGSPGVDLNVTALADAGVRRISVGSAFARRAYGAFIDAAREVADHGTFGETAKAMGFAEIEEWLPTRPD
ncbi:isocitrate lyase/PEP mutase family protein [Sulfitobacter aestuariivivens]|uniref:Isocitrate lyase/phosphoenolpyruvate mutase family protein n=1 Tax=Sulfitobacter aestuariivivens TaxID=2766981 RepID=A0A927HDQ6_9RHOB|nr:isocitrate lyase/phosphoenolpyruvate mutase family protein [Sulfitobacter aestuariivivens]MBD3663086.1 isocitrate lyase/phosphoenolpyruvate mutase family protein [Sulfitobacter aestuariivivens]